MRLLITTDSLHCKSAFHLDKTRNTKLVLAYELKRYYLLIIIILLPYFAYTEKPRTDVDYNKVVKIVRQLLYQPKHEGGRLICGKYIATHSNTEHSCIKYYNIKEQVVKKLFLDAKMTPYSEYIYRRDSTGRLIKSRKTVANGKDLFTTTYEYSTNEFLKITNNSLKGCEISFQQYDPKTTNIQHEKILLDGKLQEETNWEYDSNQNLISHICNHKNYKSIIKFTYNDQNQKIIHHHQLYDTLGLKSSEFYTLSDYNKEGLLTAETMVGLSERQAKVKRFNPKTEKQDEEWYGERTYLIGHIKFYEYDEHGSVIKISSRMTETSDNPWENRIIQKILQLGKKQFPIYYKNADIISVFSGHNESFDYEYNSKGDYVRRVEYTNDTPNLITIAQIEYIK